MRWQYGKEMKEIALFSVVFKCSRNIQGKNKKIIFKSQNPLQHKLNNRFHSTAICRQKYDYLKI